MTPNDPIQPAQPTDAPSEQVETPSMTSLSSDSADDSPKKRILIGSQRDPAAYRARQRRDWKPIEEKAAQPKKPPRSNGDERPSANKDEGGMTPGLEASGNDVPRADAVGLEKSATAQQTSVPPRRAAPRPSTNQLVNAVVAALGKEETGRVPKPSVRDKLSPELEDELALALGDASMEDLLGGVGKTDRTALEADSVQAGRVIAIRRDDVFVEFAGGEQGIVSLRLFDDPPSVGSELQVVVQRLNPEDGLYELSLPNRAVQVDDWSDLVEGAIIEVRVTGHNTGGLECEVNHIRGFIPVSQIALYRVEDLAQFVDQRFACVITEANPDRRNLVLSRRALLEREREQSRQQLLDTLRPGQVRDGVVRKLMDFGAFIDLGGVDGLLHISQLAWGRVKHPSEVLQEGQAIKVRVEKIDPTTGKISLAYRDLLESPWEAAAMKFPSNTIATGKVTKLMDFGAFVELEPGIEGLVHISELSHKRVWRCSDVVKEGQEVQVMVLSVDTSAQRMSLSMKQMSAPPEPVKKQDEPGEAEPVQKKPTKPTGPLKGGLGRSTGAQFGLKW